MSWKSIAMIRRGASLARAAPGKRWSQAISALGFGVAGYF
jgi:hypothetical protein